MVLISLVNEWDCSGAVCHRQEPVFCLGRSLCLHTDFGHCGHAASVCGMKVLIPRNPCNYMDYYSFPTPEGSKADLAGT